MNRISLLTSLTCAVVFSSFTICSADKLTGQWNSHDTICDGNVNGLLQNKGADVNPSSGPICLQSEGSPIEFRNIYLDSIPKR